MYGFLFSISLGAGGRGVPVPSGRGWGIAAGDITCPGRARNRSSIFSASLCNPCISVPSKKGLYWMGSRRVGADTRHNGKAPSPIYGGKSVLWYLVGGNCS